MARKPKKFIQKAVKRMKRKGTEGAFSAAAKRQGMSTQAFASKILANKERYSAQLVKRAVFARNAMRAGRGRKKRK